MVKTKSAVTFFSLLGSWMCYGISFLIPKKKNLWVFHGWHTTPTGEIFADNAKYLFLFVSQQYPTIEAVWISKDRNLTQTLRSHGLRAYDQKSFWGRWYATRAFYTCVDAFLSRENWQWTGGTKIVQLWHGKGFKKIGNDTPYGFKRYNRFISPYLFQKPFKALASSAFTKQMFESAFTLSADKFIISGQPRNDVLFTSIPCAEIDTPKVTDKIQTLKQKNKKPLLYTPTFRADGSNPLLQLQLDTLNKFLEAHSFHLFMSLHPKFSRKEHALGQVQEQSNITLMEPGLDLYPLVREFDLMITDYSSFYIDFLLVDKPLVFFIYDFEKYSETVGLYENALAEMPGEKPKSFDELLSALIQKDTWQDERKRVRDMFFTHQDGHGSQKIVEQLLQKNSETQNET